MTRYGRIYIIRNTVNDKVYVGQTHVSIKLRFQNHLSAARRGLDYVIGKAIRKYGEDKFYVELLEECLVEELNEREQYWISFFEATNNRFGYNISIGGNVVRTTKKLNEDKVLQMFNSGIGSYEIAKLLHVHPYKTAEILKKHNIIYGAEKQKRQDEKEIASAYLSGKSTMDICREFNINKSTVRRILLRNNIKLRSKGKNKNSERDSQTLK
jgi:group I intron endonuclease